MAYEPRYTISPRLLSLVEAIAALRERIQGAAVELTWLPAMQKDTRTRNTHASTAIEGNPLTLEEVRAIEEGRDFFADPRSKREVVNYLAGLRYVEKHVSKKRIRHEDVFALHRILAEGVMDQGRAGRYRDIPVRVGAYVPPAPGEVSGLMFEFLDWWNHQSTSISPVISSAIVHYRFEAIHPFADGNGRVGRALALWELYRRGFDTHHIFSVDEFYWDDRPRYYSALESVRHEGDDLTSWLEYSAEGLRQTLDRVWLRVQSFSNLTKEKIVLRPKQERLLALLRDIGSMSPAEIWVALDISKQGAMDLIKPLVEAGLIEKVGGKKTGRYQLRKP
ncbi:MAG TPA: Fic family protein [Spirochaetota bacterium]|nr:Fic family protein [Spirochaetota bacterium]